MKLRLLIVLFLLSGCAPQNEHLENKLAYLETRVHQLEDEQIEMALAIEQLTLASRTNSKSINNLTDATRSNTHSIIRLAQLQGYLK